MNMHELANPFQTQMQEACHKASASNDFLRYMYDNFSDDKAREFFDGYVGRVFEACCTPNNADLTDDIMSLSKYYNVVPAWANIVSITYQADRPDRDPEEHHDWQSAVHVTLIWTAKLLKELPLDDPSVQTFTSATGMAPQNWLEKHYHAHNKK